jgi:hypothetical protein
MGILGHRNLDPVAEPIALFEQYVTTIVDVIKAFPEINR